MSYIDDIYLDAMKSTNDFLSTGFFDEDEKDRNETLLRDSALGSILDVAIEQKMHAKHDDPTSQSYNLDSYLESVIPEETPGDKPMTTGEVVSTLSKSGPDFVDAINSGQIEKSLWAGTENLMGAIGGTARWLTEPYIDKPLGYKIGDVDVVNVLNNFDWYKKLYKNTGGKLNKWVSDYGKETKEFWDKETQTGWEARPDKLKDKDAWLKYPFTMTIRTVGESGSSYAFALGASYATANPKVGLAFMSIMAGEGTYSAARDKGSSPMEANLYAALDTAWNAASEGIPFETILGNQGKKALTRIAKGGVTEGLQELFQGMGSNLIAKYGYDESVKMMDGWLENIVGGVGLGSIGGGAIGGGKDVDILTQLARDVLSSKESGELFRDPSSPKTVDEVAKNKSGFGLPSEALSELDKFKDPNKQKGETPVLDEVDNIINIPKTKTTLKEKAKNFVNNIHTALVSEFAPLKRLEKDVYKSEGKVKPKLDMARKFEQVAGAKGKAEADLIDFKKKVVAKVEDDYDDFNKYLFLKRTQQRLESDPDRKKVGNWTVDKATQGLAELESKIGTEKFNNLEQVATKEYQEVMDRALKLQVQSGRMTEKLYNKIKEENDFYAPFKVLQSTDEFKSGVQGTGRKIDVTTDLTKKITGITSEDFHIGDIIAKSAEQIYKSRLLAEKNIKMQEVGALADMDKIGRFIQKVDSDAKPKEGFELVQYQKNGEKITLQVPKSVASALEGLNHAQAAWTSKMLSAVAQPFRWGATSFNASFQSVNLFFADLPRHIIISKYGINNPKDLLMFPFQGLYALFTSMTGNFGRPNQLYTDWLRSGAANSTIQRQLTPEVFKSDVLKGQRSLGKEVLGVPGTILSSVAKFSNAIEETTKILTLNKAFNKTKFNTLTKAEQKTVLEDIATEVRNYGGSPDFLRMGPAAKQLNLLFMFFNARVQGIAADVSRLSGKDGTVMALKSWGKLAVSIGLPTIALHLKNLSPEYEDDYAKISETEKQNYFMIPRDKFFTNAKGQKVREYWRIPKREIVKLFANTIEGGIDFAKSREPERLANLGMSLIEDVSPINIQGENIDERIESVVGSMNPLIKAPVEWGLGRDTFFHSDTIPTRLKRVSPELQYTDRTPEAFKKAGDITGLSPLKIEQLTRSMTAGGLTQFMSGKKQEDRGFIANNPVLKRYSRSSYVDDKENVDILDDMLRNQADERITTFRKTEKDYDNMKSKMSAQEIYATLDEILDGIGSVNNPNIKKAKLIRDMAFDEMNGLTYTDRLTKQLGVANGKRAEFIKRKLSKLNTGEEKMAYIEDLANKKIISENVLDTLIESLMGKQND